MPARGAIAFMYVLCTAARRCDSNRMARCSRAARLLLLLLAIAPTLEGRGRGRGRGEDAAAARDSTRRSMDKREDEDADENENEDKGGARERPRAQLSRIQCGGRKSICSPQISDLLSLRPRHFASSPPLTVSSLSEYPSVALSRPRKRPVNEGSVLYSSLYSSFFFFSFRYLSLALSFVFFLPLSGHLTIPNFHQSLSRTYTHSNAGNSCVCLFVL